MTINGSWCVYRHTSPSGKVYIGIAKDVRHRWRNHGAGYKGSTRIANAIQKYGWDNFKHDILFRGLTREEACEKEIELIRAYDSDNPQHGYNLMSGGQCGTPNIETLERMRKAQAGHPVSKNVREILSIARSIPVVCIETGTVYNSAKEASLALGISRTSIGKVCGGKAATAGGLHFAKQSDYKRNSIPQFKVSNKNKKRIVCITTGEVFESETDAARKYGVTSQAISHACTGKVKSCCGLAWTEEKRPEMMDIPARKETQTAERI